MTDDALREACEEISEWIYIEPNEDECIKRLLTFAKQQRAAGMREAIIIVESFSRTDDIACAIDARAKELER